MNNAIASKDRNTPNGFTLLEVLVALICAAILVGIATANLNKLSASVDNGSYIVASYIKKVRARAISSTLAYKIEPSGSRSIQSSSGTNCDTLNWSYEPSLDLPLPSGVSLVGSSWSICITARGLPSGNETLHLRDIDSRTKTVEVMLGGAVRTY